MREVLFRGQTRRYGEKVWMNGEKVPSNWVYGGICQGKGAFSIIYGSYDEELENPVEKHVIYTDTIGQYTGLTDKNGKKIFEGDIVKTEKFNTPNKHYVIKYDLLLGAFIGENDGTMYFTTFDGDSELFEIIGNIHDNPELLKGGVE